MSIRNKILVVFYLEEGCKQEDGEVNISWQPINFLLYSEMFPEIINESIAEWLSDNTIERNIMYEVIFAHTIEQDGGGAVLGEYFEPVYKETQIM